MIFMMHASEYQQSEHFKISKDFRFHRFSKINFSVTASLVPPKKASTELPKLRLHLFLMGKTSFLLFISKTCESDVPKVS